ncbi:glycerophosphodiester phosphodiesterase [Deinococcus roseus]|uniref:Glycerophosphoryl diester phosphodiesterase n=1 Tax=Deinococcus roseus TaxID=392414 RepID=A0ABQ2CZ11_9DEIO|nr:glycerophosphodiester phosphodiesterase family protein [Deinococcus roseus]GGJ35058.1 glycerophosphoryl diester phosphodiesterase [Deinococcus roseus]
MKRLGHRGTPRTHRENTLEGFQNALICGLDGIELDTQPTRDGQMVVFHDEHLPDGRLLASLTWQEIQQEFPFVPLLSDVLGWAKDHPGFLINVELKNDSNVSDGREKHLMEVLKKYGMHEQMVISSFNPISLVRLYALDSSYRLGFLYDGEHGLEWLATVGLHLPLYSLHPHHTQVTEDLLSAARNNKKQVFTWTVNDLALMQKFKAWGLDAVIGDVPEVLLGEG